MYCFIVNPLAGSGRGARYAEEISRILKQKGIEYRLKLTEYANHAKELAKQLCKEKDCSAIVAVGGDGTLCEVLNGMDMSVPLGLIAAGTCNDYARSAGLSFDCGTALEDILTGIPVFTDYIMMNEWRCLNVCGTGFDVDLSLIANRIKKRIKGPLSYYSALFLTLLHFPFRPAEITIDENPPLLTEIMLIAAANGKKYGGGLPIAPVALLDDGWMDVVIIKKLPRWKIPYLLIRFLKGGLLQITRYVEHYRCKSVLCTLKEDIAVNVDGEIVSSTPFIASICHKELKFYMPMNKDTSKNCRHSS